MNPAVEEQFLRERDILLKKISLGESLTKLESNKEFKELKEYLNSLLESNSSYWATTDDNSAMLTMRALLIFNHIISNIHKEALNAKSELNTFNDFENNL